MKHKIIGLVGGLGPETGCMVCLDVNIKFKMFTNRQPHILLDNLPITHESEKKLIGGGPSQEHLNLLIKSVERLNMMGASFIAIACNTVHIFIDELRRDSLVPILSIIEETSKICVEMKLSKVGLLGSTKTIETGLHSKELNKSNIKAIIPNKEDQEFISKCIIRIINKKIEDDDKEKIIEIIKSLQNNGAKGIILGCTDLPLLISENDSDLPIINTTKILVNSIVNRLKE